MIEGHAMVIWLSASDILRSGVSGSDKRIYSGDTDVHWWYFEGPGCLVGIGGHAVVIWLSTIVIF